MPHEGHPEFQVLRSSSEKSLFESECVVKDMHCISTSMPAKRRKKGCYIDSLRDTVVIFFAHWHWLL